MPSVSTSLTSFFLFFKDLIFPLEIVIDREKISIVGFNVQNESYIVAVPQQCRINVVLKNESKRDPPTIVYFGKK